MKRTLRLATLAVSAFLSVAPAQAIPIVTSALRQIDDNNFGSGGPFVFSTNATSGNIDVATSANSGTTSVFEEQDSNILAAEFAGSGQANTTGSGAPSTLTASSNSFFDVVFDLAVP